MNVFLCDRCSWPSAICPCITSSHELAKARAAVEHRHRQSVARAWLSRRTESRAA